MISRFSGVDGERLLKSALESHKYLAGLPGIALELIKSGSLKQFEIGENLILQNATDNDIYFLISGSVSILVNDREIALRQSGNHVGEMSLIDPSANRSATVRAKEKTVALMVSESKFSEIAKRNPQLWRSLAVELGSRLRERNKFVRVPNPIPHVFLGSSAESLTIAREIQAGFTHDKIVSTVWTDGVFRASGTPIEDLAREVNGSDFAILVLAGEDKLFSRGDEHFAPRDNVIFELGLFMGPLGRERTFIVKQRGLDLKVPSDLIGITPIEYPNGPPETLASRIAPVCNEIRKVIARLGSK